MRIATQVLYLVILAFPASGQDLNPGIPFAKVMNPAFAMDYSEITITTRAQFVAPDPTPGYPWGTKILEATAGLAGFQVVAPGQKPPSGPTQTAPHVFIAKASADLLFELKQGDPLVLTGHTCVGDADSPYVVFIADTVSLEQPAAAE